MKPTAIALTLLVLSLSAYSVAAQSTTIKSTSENEHWVEQQIRKGEAADLAERDSPDISAYFLAGLLKHQPASKTSKGIEILNATVSGELSLAHVWIPVPITLDNCTFSGGVSLRDCIFDGVVSFSGSNFQKGLSIRGSAFAHESVFYKVKVDGDLRANKAYFLSEPDQVNFDSVNVTGTIHFYETEFDGPFTLMNSRMSELECTRAQFKHDADLYSIGVTGNANFTEASFAGQTNFGGMDIGKSLELSKVHFIDPSQTISFFDMKAGRNVFLLRHSLPADLILPMLT